MSSIEVIILQRPSRLTYHPFFLRPHLILTDILYISQVVVVHVLLCELIVLVALDLRLFAYFLLDKVFLNVRHDEIIIRA